MALSLLAFPLAPRFFLCFTALPAGEPLLARFLFMTNPTFFPQYHVCLRCTFARRLASRAYARAHMHIFISILSVIVFHATRPRVMPKRKLTALSNE